MPALRPLPRWPGPAVALWAALASPVVLIFLSSNFVNAGNLAFNMLFSRWMGPALFGDLALVLTIKLALLGLFGAVQMAVSRHVAMRGGYDDADLSRLNAACFVALWCLLPVLLAIVWAGDAGGHLGMGDPHILLIILLSLPFAGPLSLLRGVVQGRMDVPAVLASANVEMLVRLGGGTAAWQLGLGIEGVVAVIGLSIVAGWVMLTDKLPAEPRSRAVPVSLGVLIARAALPFACLQAAQVLLLDGDIIVAKLIFDEVTAGLVAAIGLFQRVAFFACFGLVAVLLPSVAEAVSKDRSGLRESLPVAILFAAVTCGFLLIVIAMPETLITMMAGAAYLPAADVLPLAAASASAFTLSYLLATFLAALGDFRGIWAVVAWVPLQLGAFFIFREVTGGASLNDLMVVKLGSQGALAAVLLGLAILRVHARGQNRKQNRKQAGV